MKTPLDVADHVHPVVTFRHLASHLQRPYWAENGPRMTCVLVVDDERAIRHLVADVLLDEGYIVRTAKTAPEALADIRQHRPGLILLDRMLPHNGKGVLEQLRATREGAEIPVLVLSAAGDGGLSATLDVPFLPKPLDLSHLLEHVAKLYTPEQSPSAMRRAGAAPGPDPLSGLSAQERKILPLIAQGKTNREIAAVLPLSEHTVKTYISNILQKLQLTRRAELAAFITRLKGPSPPP